MAEEIEDLFNEIQRNLYAGDGIDLQGLSPSIRYSLLRKAVRSDDSYVVWFLLDEGCPVNASGTVHDSPLHLAAESRNYEMVELLLKKGADVHSKNENGETPYLLAVVRSTSKIVELLLKHGADPYADVNVDLINAVREGYLQETTAIIDSLEQSASSGLLGGYSPLRLAIEMNHVDIAKLLLERGCPVNATETVPYSPLHFAVKNGSYEMVELLLKEGADVNSKPEEEKGLTPLHRAVERRHSAIVDLLLKFGADFNAEDNEGRTPLHFPSYSNDGYGNPNLTVESEDVILEIAKLLLNKGANINAQAHDGCTPLNMSIRRRLYSLAELFLRCNADVHLADENGFTALHLAVKVGGREIASNLLDKGADVNAKTSDGKTALYMAIRYKHEELLKMLLAKGAVVNDCLDREGDLLFYYLAQSWRPKLKEIGTLLLEWGADVNFKTETGRTALHYAASFSDGELVTFLLENGAEVNCQEQNGEAPLHRAALDSNPIIIDLLMEFGARVDCRSKGGRTPLHHGSSIGRHRVVASLLEYGADINIKCDRGRTPLDWTHYSYHDGSFRGNFGDLEIWTADTRDVLLRHQAKMEGVGLHVEESQFSARYEERLEEFRKSCQEEVLLLRSEFIEGTCVSFYDFARKDVRFLAKYMDNENLVQAAESEEYRGKFPTYANMIKRQFEKGRTRNKLLKPANQVLNQLINLPDCCIEKIMNYLCDDDLAVLIDVRDCRGLF